MFNGRRIIAIIPCYNEEKKIGKVVSRIQAMKEPCVDEILVVNDGSTDRSPEVARELGANVISLPRIMGVGAALRAGFRHALENGFDIVVVLAGNDKDEPDEIPLLLEPIANGCCDFVQGSRFLGNGEFGDMPLYRRLATRLHPFLFSLCTGKKVTESTNGFRAFSAQLLRDERIRLDQDWLNEYELEPYLYYKAIILGYKTAEVPCTKVYPPISSGYTKMKPLIGWWSILRPMILLKTGLRS